MFVLSNPFLNIILPLLLTIKTSTSFLPPFSPLFLPPSSPKTPTSLNVLDEPKSPTSQSPPKPLRVFNPTGKLKKPTIAVVGRPNVGKSALVNRLAGTQSGGAIVADESGITRDRTYRTGEFMNKKFQIIDTGGLVFDDREGLFMSQIREQAMIAISESSAVILVTDGMSGLSSMDLALAEYLRREVLRDKVPVHVAVNKCESEKTGAASAAEFWKLGLGEPNPVSAIHGVGTAELMEKVFDDIMVDSEDGKTEVMTEADEFLLDYGITGSDDDGDDGFSQLSKREQRKVRNRQNNLDDEYDVDDDMVSIGGGRRE